MNLSNAKPIINYVMDNLASGQDLSDPKVKREIADQVLPLLEDVASPIERDAYRLRLATLLRLDERTLVLSTNQVLRERDRSKRRQTKPTEVSSQIISLERRNRPLEEFTLVNLLTEPESLYLINRALVSFGLPELTRVIFSMGIISTV